MSEEIATTGRSLRADARRNRERILEAARTVVAEQGVDAQMDDIARAAGVGVGTLYRHFPHKDALLGELIAAKFRAFIAHAEDALVADDPWDGFAGLLRANAELCASDAGVRAAMAAGPEAWRLAEPELVRLLHLGDRIIRRAQEAGALRADFKVDEVPLVMCGVGATMSVPVYDWRRYLEIVLDGLRA
jgi:AcrR family transcriptional regulator